MITGAEWLLVGAVASVGVLHTIVPDHWIPITVVARQRGWTKREVARAAVVAGTGHTVSTLLIGLVVWIAGVSFATRFGNAVSIASTVALIAFGSWIALSSLRDLRSGGGHGHTHGHGHGHDHGHGHGHGHRHETTHGFHGPERQRIATDTGVLELSIFETGSPPYFRLSGASADRVSVETRREDGERRRFDLADRGDYWQSLDEIPEPHEFAVTVTVDRAQHLRSYETSFTEHDHDHGGANHASRDGRSSRTALLLILGSSPMVEGIPAFFAAGRYGPILIALMALVFAVSTIATYVVMCVSSVAGLRQVRFGWFERYGEVLSGAFIAVVGLVFVVFPIF